MIKHEMTDEESDSLYSMVTNKALIKGHFLLKSGYCSQYYFIIENLPDVMFHRFVLDLVEKLDFHEVDAILGLETGGFNVLRRVREILRYERSTPVFHEIAKRRGGTGFQLNYEQKVALEGKRVILLDDVMSGGTACDQLGEELKPIGAMPMCLGVIMNRSYPTTTELASGLKVVHARRLLIEKFVPYIECPMCLANVPRNIEPKLGYWSHPVDSKIVEVLAAHLK